MTLGMSERSAKTRKLSTPFPNAHLDAIEREAKLRGDSAASIVREAVAFWLVSQEKHGTSTWDRSAFGEGE